MQVLNSSIADILKNSNLTLPRREGINSINAKLAEYENSIFNNDEQTQILLNNEINYINAINLIDDSCVVNLRWLKSLSENTDGIVDQYVSTPERMILKFIKIL